MAAARITVPSDVIFGGKSFEGLGQIARTFGKKAVVVCIKVPGVIDRVRKTLSSSDVEMVLYEEMGAEPTIEYADEGARLSRESACDLVISVGGGSVIDTGKVVALLQKNPGSSRDYQMGAREIREPVLPHIAVPTTSGTGAEATRVAVLTNKQAGVKKSILHNAIVPAVAILDPELTVTMPPRLTALTGLDALSHAVEPFVSTNANAISDACALKAIELVGKRLRRAVASGTDIQARADMAMASYLGGISLNGGVGAAHILAQPLGAATGMSHGLAVAILLPHVMEVNYRHSLEKYARIAAALGEDISGLPLEDAAKLSAVAVARLCHDVGITDRLCDHNLKEG